MKVDNNNNNNNNNNNSFLSLKQKLMGVEAALETNPAT
jgi:hypothetical protein